MVPWYAWVGITFVAFWGVIGLIAVISWSRRKDNPALAEAIVQNSEVNKALLEKLGTIETRLGAVEKTLNDIPN
ncbi:MAG TPA: hypothetical protein VGI56_06145 [Galbitalea sp.]|jgi:hypothetical protein